MLIPLIPDLKTLGMMMNRCKFKILGIGFWLIFQLAGVLAQNQTLIQPDVTRNTVTPDILVVYSYTPNLQRSVLFSAGLRSYFERTNIQIRLHELFLDDQSQQNTPGCKAVLLQEYLQAWLLDSTRTRAVVFADVESSGIAGLIKPDLLENIPVVFNGVESLVCGNIAHKRSILYSIDFVSNFLLGRRLFPEARNVLIITDHSLSGQIQRKMAEEQLASYRDDVNFLFLPPDGVTLDGMKQELEKLPPESFVILSDFEIDKNGQYVDLKKDISVLSSMNRFPVFGMTTDVLGETIIGGFLTDYRDQGEDSGLLLDRIFKGDETVTSDTIRNLLPVFDKQLLDKWNIGPELLPPGSVVTGSKADQKFSYLTIIIWGLLGIVVVLIVLFVIMLFYKRAKGGKRRHSDSFTRKQREMINLSFSVIDDGVILLDLNFLVIEINPTAKELLNVSDEIIGKAFDEFVEIIIPGAADDDEGDLWKIMTRVVKTRARVDITNDMHLITADGPVLHVVGAVSPIIDRNNEMKGIVMTFKDATREFRRKQQLTQTIVAARSFYWHYCIDDDVFTYDVGFNKICYLPGEFLTLEQYISHIAPVDRTHFRDQIKYIVDGEGIQFCMEYRMDFLLSSEYVCWESRGTLEKTNQDGRIIRYILGVSYNVENRKAKENDLLETVRKAVESDRLKSSFLANMSHEIRTPLNGIVGFVNLLSEDSFTQEDKQMFIKTIDENSKLLLNLLNDILDLSKIESNMIPFNFRPCYINGLVNNVLTTYSIHSHEKVILRAEIPDENIRITTDPTRLTQVLNNLINNALKFTTEGEIVITCRKIDDGLEFSVKDTGKGISEEHLSQLFTQFFKGYNSIQGTGLGLSISKAIIERLGGTMLVESKLGMGTVFYFTIYDQDVDVPENQSESVQETPEAKLITDSVNRNILIAEDTDSNYYLLSAILGNDYILERAFDGDEAVDMFMKKSYGLILMDVKMPRMDGIEAITEIRKVSHAIPIIVQTAYAFSNDRERAFEAGCNDFITKPIRAKELKELVAKYFLNRN